MLPNSIALVLGMTFMSRLQGQEANEVR